MFSGTYLTTIDRADVIGKVYGWDNATGLVKGTILAPAAADCIAERMTWDSADALRDHLEAAPPQRSAHAWGVFSREKVRVFPKAQLPFQKESTDGWFPAAMTKDAMHWPTATGSILMIDCDQEGVAADDLIAAIQTALGCDPDMVLTASGSGFLWHGDRQVRGPRGWRLHIPLVAGITPATAGRKLVSRLWLMGAMDWTVSEAGALLERGLVDPTVWAPERPDFTGGATLRDGLVQHRPAPRLIRGTLRALQTIPPAAGVVEMRDSRKAALRLDAAKQSAAHRAAKGLPPAYGRAGRLLPPLFKVRMHGGGVVQVIDILMDRRRFLGRRCGDPDEPDYGEGRAAEIVIHAKTGKLAIVSYAHGTTTSYPLE